MFKKVKLFTVAALSVFALSSAVLPAAVFASPADEIGKGVVSAGGTGSEDLSANIIDIVNVLLFILGAVAVIVIVIAGFRFVVANGDSNSVASARNTILYAVVGLAIAILSYAIVNFVIKNLS
ncbi:MAG: hypothetical protein WAQ22_04330 [Candidatus Saccharimonas sp.]